MIAARVVTHRGMEDIAAREVTLLGGQDIFIIDSSVFFCIQDVQALCKLMYASRSVMFVYWKICSWQDHFPEDVDFSFLKDKTFVVEGENKKEVGAWIVQKTKSKVCFANPDFTFLVQKEEKVLSLYLDVAGIDLSKRDYRVFLGPSDMKGTLAYGLLQIAEWTPDKILLDPFCQAGTIVIEAALSARKKPILYHAKNKLTCAKMTTNAVFDLDKQMISEKEFGIIASDPHFKHVSASQKNAKIAQVNKCMTFTRQDIDWIDVKFQHKSIDCIVTCIPPDKDLKKDDVKLLFVRGQKILKKNGTITILAKTKQQEILQEAKEFVLKEQRTVWQGQAALTIFVFSLSK